MAALCSVYFIVSIFKHFGFLCFINRLVTNTLTSRGSPVLKAYLTNIHYYFNQGHQLSDYRCSFRTFIMKSSTGCGMCTRARFFRISEGGRWPPPLWQFLSPREERSLRLHSHPPGDMRRREKRLLQVAGLLLAALLFLPNVGLWSLYRDRAFYSSPNTDGAGGILPLQVSGAPGSRRGIFEMLIRGSTTENRKA